MLYLWSGDRRKASAMSLQVIYSKGKMKREIKEIATITCRENEADIEEMATKIAFEFFEKHINSDPITVARASLFIALKKHQCTSEENVSILINNNGKKNRWWLHLLPIIEKQLGGR